MPVIPYDQIAFAFSWARGVKVRVKQRMANNREKRKNERKLVHTLYGIPCRVERYAGIVIIS